MLLLLCFICILYCAAIWRNKEWVIVRCCWTDDECGPAAEYAPTAGHEAEDVHQSLFAHDTSSADENQLKTTSSSVPVCPDAFDDQERPAEGNKQTQGAGSGHFPLDTSPPDISPRTFSPPDNSPHFILFYKKN